MKAFIKKSLFALIASLIVISGVFAIQSFTVNPSSISQSIDVSQSSAAQIAIQNTGDENISFIISKENLINGGNTIILALNQTTITDLEPGQTRNIEYSYNSGTNPGVFQGSILVSQSDNLSNNISIPVQVTVNSVSNPSQDGRLEIITPNVGEPGEGTIRLSGEANDRTILDIRLENIGDETIQITNVRTTTLDGRSSFDRIRTSDIRIDKTSFSLQKDDREIIELRVDIPRNIEVDIYQGDFIIETQNHGNFIWSLEVDVYTDSDDDIYVRDNLGDIRNKMLRLVGESGENIRNALFYVQNDAGSTQNGIYFELASDLREQNSANTIARSTVSFSPSTLSNFRNGDRESVRLSINIPSNAATGTYYADVNVLKANGERLDSFRLELRVVGDIYVKDIIIPENSKPGDLVDVKVTVRNQGSQLYRNIVIRGILFDITTGSSDIFETTSSFLLDVGEEVERTLRFRLPHDAIHGSHTLEIRVQAPGEEIIEIRRLDVVRPLRNIEIQTNSINPVTARCDFNLYSYLKVQNLGRFSEQIRFVAQIQGTDISAESNLIDIGVDQVMQDTKVLDISSLEPGNYKLLQRVLIGSIFETVESNFQVLECSDSTIGGIDIEDLNNQNNNQTNQTITDKEGFTLFGEEVEPTTIYLATAVGIVIILIIISLFFL